jgi:serine/threonine protein kinase
MIGRRILNYKIESVIGKGGMGEVYLATHETIGRKVAIKSLLPNLIGHSDIRQRFINEAKVMSQLSHTNIVGLLDYHEEPDGLYLIMDYVDGTPLDELIKNVTGPIGGEACINYVRQILEAFNYAHSRGMVHRDIKPSNVMVTRDGQVKVLDFGIAKILDSGTSSLTKTGAQMGTVYYMSPEQVEGKEADVRSDIYSLGVTIYQIATGTNPYHGVTTEYEIYTKIVKEQLPDPKSIYPGVSDSIAALILKATAKNPSDRFQTCKEMLDVLRSGEVVNIPQPKSKGAPKKSVNVKEGDAPKSKRKYFVIGSILLVLGALVYAYTAGIFNLSEKKEKISLFPVMVNEKISYFDSRGKEIIAAQFAEASLFYEGIAVVNTGGDEPKYGYIDQTGKYLINPQFEEATIFSDGIAWVSKRSSKISAINTTGKELFSVDASYVENYSEELAVFAPNYPEKGSSNLKMGYLDKDGDIKIPAKFDYAGSFKNGRAQIGVREKTAEGDEKMKYAFIDKSAKIVGDYYDELGDYEGDFAIVGKDNKYGSIDKNGKQVIPIMYDYLQVDGEWFIYASADEKFGWLDKEGKVIINAQFDGCQKFNEADLAPIEIADKWGYIARDGKISINPQYDAACSFKGDITAVEQAGKYGFIDKEGKFVIAPNLTALSPDLLAAIDNSYLLGLSYKTNRWAQSQYFDAISLANNLNLESPGGFDPRTSTFGTIKGALDMSDSEFSKEVACYPSGTQIQGGGLSHGTTLEICGEPWSVSTYEDPQYFYGYYYGSVTRTSSYFNDNALPFFRYTITPNDNFEQNSNNLIAELNKRLQSEGYANLSENAYAKNGINVSFRKNESADKTGDSLGEVIIFVWKPAE